MYRGQEPAYCRGCGVEWTPGAARCGQCGEPARPPTASDGFGRALPAFTDQRALVVGFTGLAVAYGVMLLVSLHNAWFDRGVLLELVRGVEVSEAALEAVDADLWFNVATFLAYLVLAVVFGVWLVRAGRNLRSRGIIETRETDETRLLWFFVPVVHLYRPLQGIAELWRGSTAEDPAHWSERPLPWLLLGSWWASWLATNALENISIYLRYDAVTAPQLLSATEYDLASTAVRVACLPLLIVLVHRIERAQRAHRPGR